MATLIHSRNPEYHGKSVLSSGASGFQDPPSIFLHGEAGVRWALDNLDEWTSRPTETGGEKRKPPYPHPFEYCVHSDWLIGLIDEIVSGNNKGFAYNVDVLHLARERLGLPKLPDAEACKEGSALSLLIYNAQGFRRDRDLRDAGLLPLTQEMIDEAARTKQQIELSDGTRCNVRAVEGKNYAFKPRKRNYAVGMQAPAKIVPRQRKRA